MEEERGKDWARDNPERISDRDGEEMKPTDKQEDELLQEIERSLILYGAKEYNTERTAKNILAKVKEKYVPWDREKVAEFMSRIIFTLAGGKMADRLHKILTGGE